MAAGGWPAGLAWLAAGWLMGGLMAATTAPLQAFVGKMAYADIYYYSSTA
jgi:hypothetical protein